MPRAPEQFIAQNHMIETGCTKKKKKKKSQMDYYLVNLSSKTYVFEDNSTKHQSARLIFSFSVVTIELGASVVIHILSQLIISGLVDNGLN